MHFGEPGAAHVTLAIDALAGKRRRRQFLDLVGEASQLVVGDPLLIRSWAIRPTAFAKEEELDGGEE